MLWTIIFVISLMIFYLKINISKDKNIKDYWIFIVIIYSVYKHLNKIKTKKH